MKNKPGKLFFRINYHFSHRDGTLPGTVAFGAPPKPSVGLVGASAVIRKTGALPALREFPENI